MKFRKLQVLGLAGALVLGTAVSGKAMEAEKAPEAKKPSIHLGLNAKFFFKHIGKMGKTTKIGFSNDYDHAQNVFYADEIKVEAEGEITKNIGFFGELEASAEETEIGEAGINWEFYPGIQVRLGKQRVPFMRYQITDEYTDLIPTIPGRYVGSLETPNIDPYEIIEGNPYTVAPYGDGRVDAGAVIHGALADGMVRYNIGIFNEKEAYKGFEYTARIDFTPTMLGFKPEEAEVNGHVKDTYLGKKKVLNIGLAYDQEKDEANDITRKGYTFDIFYEQKFNIWVPNFQFAYVNLKDSHYSTKSNKGLDSKAWYVQGQLLYDEVIGVGKPALALRYDSIDSDESGKVSKIGIALNYYIGEKAKASAGVDFISYDDEAKTKLTNANCEDSLTNFYLYFQVKF